MNCLQLFQLCITPQRRGATKREQPCSCCHRADVGTVLQRCTAANLSRAHTTPEWLSLASTLWPLCRPNMVTNLGVPACSAVNSRSIYVDGVTYAIQKLGALTNVATYLDIGHSGCAA